MNCDKCNYTIDENLNVNKSYLKLSRCLNRFVIKNIRNNLKFPITWNTPIAKVGIICLLLSYFVIGKKSNYFSWISNQYDKIIFLSNKHKNGTNVETLAKIKQISQIIAS